MPVEPQQGRISRSLKLFDVFGPIFTKELRVSARQKRNYWLRFFYVILFLILLALVWYSTVRFSHYNPLFYSRRLHEAVMMLLTAIGGFQFFALQLVAPVLTCTAISDEANRCTLDVLMTTPITSVQIVLGKLFSKMLFMILLTAATLPMLALLRVFGGIEWWQLVWILGLTISSAFFNATLGLLYSIFFRRSYVAILAAYFTLGSLYFLIPFMIAITSGFSHASERLFTYFNPFASLVVLFEQMVTSRRSIYWFSLSPAIQCSLQVAAGIIVIILCVRWIRRKVCNSISGEVRALPIEKDAVVPSESETFGHRIVEKLSPPREVTDRPVLWRELHIPLIRNRTWRYSIFAGAGLLLIWIYGFTVEDFADEDIQIGFTVVFQCLIFITAIILSAPTVSREKETNTWEMLMTTPLAGREIVWGKTWGILNRVLPVSLLYFGHVIPCACTELLHPFMLIAMVPLIAGPVFFLVGTGILISHLVKKTVTAVVLSFLLAAVLWVGVPTLGAVLDEVKRTGNQYLVYSACLNPIALNCYIIDSGERSLRYNQLNWVAFNLPFNISTRYTTVWVLGFYVWAVSLGYFLLGVLALCLAGRRWRLE